MRFGMAYVFPNYDFDSNDMKTRFFTKREFDTGEALKAKSAGYKPPQRDYKELESHKTAIKSAVSTFVNSLVDLKKTKQQLAYVKADPQRYKDRLAQLKVMGEANDGDTPAELDAIRARLYDARVKKLSDRVTELEETILHPSHLLFDKFNPIKADPHGLETLKLVDTNSIFEDFQFQIIKVFDDHKIKVEKEIKELRDKEAKKAQDDADTVSLLKKLHDDPKKAEITLGKLVDSRVEKKLDAMLNAKLKELQIPKGNQKPKGKEAKNEQTPARGRQNNRGNARGRGARGRGGKAQGQGEKKEEKNPKRGAPAQRGRGRGRGRGGAQ